MAIRNAESLVAYLQNRIPAFADFPTNATGLYKIVSDHLRRHDWYDRALKDVLARAGDLPLQLPELAAFLQLVRDEHTLLSFQVARFETAASSQPTGGTSFIPRIALAKLTAWEGTFHEEYSRLVQMENALLDVKWPPRRKDLFVFLQLLRSVTPTAIVHHEKRRDSLSIAQSEFVKALNARHPSLGDDYEHYRHAYLETLHVFHHIERSRALTIEIGGDVIYHPDRLWDSLQDDRAYEFSSFEWTDPARKDWEEEWEPWEIEFARELLTGTPWRRVTD